MSDMPLGQLLARGDRVAIANGRLVITPVSGKEVPPEWLQQHERRLINEAAAHTGPLALAYLGYSSGNYGPHGASGVTLQFRCLATGGELYTIFNADTTRRRTTRSGKAGDPLPKGRFRVSPRSHFYQFWKSTGLPYHRLSDFHDYMGNLGALVYTASISEGARLDAATLRPLTLALPDNSPTPSRQAPDNLPTRNPDKESHQTQQRRGLQRLPSTGQEKHGNTVTRERGYTGIPLPPEEQTNDEWLAEYDRAPGADYRPKGKFPIDLGWHHETMD